MHLKCESNKWKFIIKPERLDTFSETKILVILINEIKDMPIAI